MSFAGSETVSVLRRPTTLVVDSHGFDLRVVNGCTAVTVKESYKGFLSCSSQSTGSI